MKKRDMKADKKIVRAKRNRRGKMQPREKEKMTETDIE